MDDYFAGPEAREPDLGGRTPAPHEVRVEFLRGPERRTRWRSTPTTFGPWVKLPVSFYLLVRPVLIVTREVGAGRFPPMPHGALEVVADGLVFGVGVWIATSLWRSGRVGPR